MACHDKRRLQMISLICVCPEASAMSTMLQEGKGSTGDYVCIVAKMEFCLLALHARNDGIGAQFVVSKTLTARMFLAGARRNFDHQAAWAKLSGVKGFRT